MTDEESELEKVEDELEKEKINEAKPTREDDFKEKVEKLREVLNDGMEQAKGIKKENEKIRKRLNKFKMKNKSLHIMSRIYGRRKRN